MSHTSPRRMISVSCSVMARTVSAPSVSIIFREIKERDIAPVTQLTASPGRTISGIQRKLLVVKEGTGFIPAGPTGLAPYIAKFNSERERVQSLVRNENLSLRWSAELLGKDEINEFTLGTVAVLNETALIVTRFDRKSDGSKLRLEDFAQILNKPRVGYRDFAGQI